MWPFKRRKPKTLAEKARRHAEGLEGVVSALRAYRCDRPEFMKIVKNWADALDPMVREFRFVIDNHGPRERANEILIEMGPVMSKVCSCVTRGEIPLVPAEVLDLCQYEVLFRETQHRGESLRCGLDAS